MGRTKQRENERERQRKRGESVAWISPFCSEFKRGLQRAVGVWIFMKGTRRMREFSPILVLREGSHARPHFGISHFVIKAERIALPF
jgi:hypothetical protein